MSLPDIYPNLIGDALVEQGQPLIDLYGDDDDAFLTYLQGLGEMYKEVDDIARDGDNGEPGWSQIFDLERAKTEWLPWMGQLVGYQVPSRPSGQTLEEYDAIQRERIVTRSSRRRGGIDILRDVIQEQLLDPKDVFIHERPSGEAYQINVYVYADQVATSEAAVTAAALSQKVAGLIMTVTFITDQTYATLLANNEDYAEVLTDFEDYNEVFTDPANSP